MQTPVSFVLGTLDCLLAVHGSEAAQVIAGAAALVMSSRRCS